MNIIFVSKQQLQKIYGFKEEVINKFDGLAGGRKINNVQYSVIWIDNSLNKVRQNVVKKHELLHVKRLHKNKFFAKLAADPYTVVLGAIGAFFEELIVKLLIDRKYENESIIDIFHYAFRCGVSRLKKSNIHEVIDDKVLMSNEEFLQLFKMPR